MAHMNADHAEAVRLYATKLLGAEDGPWRLTGLDPEGLDLACGDANAAACRLPNASSPPSNCARWWWIWQTKARAS